MTIEFLIPPLNHNSTRAVDKDRLTLLQAFLDRRKVPLLAARGDLVARHAEKKIRAW